MYLALMHWNKKYADGTDFYILSNQKKPGLEARRIMARSF